MIPAGVLSLLTNDTVPVPELVNVGVPILWLGSTEVYPSTPLASNDLFVGQLIVGAGVPTTLTVKLQLPPFSALEATLCVPTAKNDPDAGLFVIEPQSPSPAAAP